MALFLLVFPFSDTQSISYGSVCFKEPLFAYWIWWIRFPSFQNATKAFIKITFHFVVKQLPSPSFHLLWHLHIATQPLPLPSYIAHFCHLTSFITMLFSSKKWLPNLRFSIFCHGQVRSLLRRQHFWFLKLCPSLTNGSHHLFSHLQSYPPPPLNYLFHCHLFAPLFRSCLLSALSTGLLVLFSVLLHSFDIL